MNAVDKILGADVELGNVLQRRRAATASNDEAARLLLAEIEGVWADDATRASSAPGSVRCRRADGDAAASPHARASPNPDRGPDEAPAAFDSHDWGRKYLVTNGGCAYIDSGHLELCTPEVRSARDFVAYHEANLRLARNACARANARLPAGQRVMVMANNSDRLSNSWGGHLNVLVSRRLWSQLFERMYPSLFVLVAWQVSSVLYTGQGKVGAENGKQWVPFQLTQRGDHFERIKSLATTYRRGIANERDEPHCGPGTADLARLHVIFHDTTLTQGSNFLKAGVTQLVLALMEAGWCDRRVILADPLAALTAWGHDPDLCATAALDDGREVTAIEHQGLFLAAVRRFVERGDAGLVPEAEAILDLWTDTLARLERRDYATLARRLDWVMKRELLTRLIDRCPGLDWQSPIIQSADLLYANLDPREGLYAAVAAASGTECFVRTGAIARAEREPPSDTRAWSRTMLLRHAGPQGVESVNWDEIRLRTGTAGAAATVIRLDDPRRFTRAHMRRRASADALRADLAPECSAEFDSTTRSNIDD